MRSGLAAQPRFEGGLGDIQNLWIEGGVDRGQPLAEEERAVADPLSEGVD